MINSPLNRSPKYFDGWSYISFWHTATTIWSSLHFEDEDEDDNDDDEDKEDNDDDEDKEDNDDDGDKEDNDDDEDK